MSQNPAGLPTAQALAAAVREGRASAESVVADCLARIDRGQATLNAYVTVTHDQAIARAREIDADGARSRLSLAGVPFSVKDNIETAGVRTTFGSRTLESSVPDIEAVAVNRLRAAGAVMVGKTTLPEFASSVLGSSPLTGITRNPWNTAMSPGGSSSGAAAAVAAGLAPIALTTDAGASTRLPAAACGVLGIKPSIGLVPYEIFPDGFGNFIHMGLITRTVADMALALDAISGEDPRDPLSVGIAPTKAHAALATPLDLRGQRIAFRPFLGNAALDDEVRALCEQTLASLASAGASVSTIDEPFENAGATWRVLQQNNWAGRFATPDEETARIMDPGFVAGVRAAHGMSGAELSKAVYRRTAYFRTVQAWFEASDWVATPVITATGVAADARGDAPLIVNGKPAGEIRATWGPYLNVFNLTGHPALSVPAGFTASGMPVGLQLVGRLRSDVDLLRLARLIEQARPWADRLPPHALIG
jgi:aspartyl-tRNA(Asn)/glutamyl-tRNA(Gln) amidotransferase subunit A